MESITTSADTQPPPKELPQFVYAQGPSPRAKIAKTPLEVFQLFFTNVILSSIVQQTKLFAFQKGNDMEFCIEELMAFIGLNVAMGMLHLPQVKDYWSTSKILSTPWFPSVMSRDRFLKILKFLHLVDSTLQKKKGEEGYDPLFKVRFLVDHLAAVYPQYYFPSRYLSIDEMMVGTRCRVVFLQYLPKKPTKFGIKVWINSEAKSGYVLNFQIYTGSEGKTKEKGLAYRVVMDLMEPYSHKGHCLFIDNFYTTVKLLIDLLAKGAYCTGTARSNRKYFPMEIIPAKGTQVEPGNFCFAIGKCSNQEKSVQDTNEDNSSGVDEFKDHSALQGDDQGSGKNKDGNSQQDTNQDGSSPKVHKNEGYGGRGLQDTDQDENFSCSNKDKDDSTPDNTSGQDKTIGQPENLTGQNLVGPNDNSYKIIAVWWRDRRDVLALSTMHNTSASVVMKRSKGCHEKRPLPCPTIIIDYNQYMGGVDLMDQHLSYYSLTTRRTLKWWKKVFWRLVDISIVNAWIIFHHNNADSDVKSHREFRLKLVEELVQPLLDLQASTNCPKHLVGTKGRQPVSDDKRLMGKHFAYKSSKRGRCCVCSHKIPAGSMKRKDKKTQNYCKKCEVHLCVGMCFELYHTRTTY